MRSTKKKIYRNIIALSLVLIFSFSPLLSPEARADGWPDFIGNAYGAFVKTMEETINGIALGAAKKAAMMALQSEMTYLITGQSTGGPMFVTNWQAYLVTQPRTQSNLFINDYISQSLGGRGSLTGYARVGSEGVGANYSYFSQLSQIGRAATSDQNQMLKPTYQGNPSLMFANNNGFKNLNLYLSGVNNPWAFSLNIQQQYQQQLQQQQLIAQMKINGTGGVLGKEVNGITVNPAGLVEEQVAKVQNMGIDITTAANNLSEVISGAVSSAINQAMVSGIGAIQAGVHREITNVRAQAANQLNQAIGKVGPAALYGTVTINGASSMSRSAQCNSCLNACAGSYAAGSADLDTCQTSCAPQCGGN